MSGQSFLSGELPEDHLDPQTVLGVARSESFRIAHPLQLCISPAISRTS